MLAHREASPPGPATGTVLCVHGYPEAAAMWQPVLDACATAGWRAVAPDLAGFGDSPAHPPHTWEHHVELLDAFHRDVVGEPAVLVLHDWGGLIGLRWACDHPEVARALVISNTGFFPDGRWHGLAQALRTPEQGEALLDNMTREGFGGMMRAVAPGLSDALLDEFWKAFGGPERRAGHLELYRSGDFGKLGAYEGRLAELGVPTLVLWGEDDPFAPVGGAHRFAREIPHAELELLPGAGHFHWAEDPGRGAASVVRFLGQLELLVAE